MKQVPEDEAEPTRRSSPENSATRQATEYPLNPAERLEFTASLVLPSVDILLADNIARAWEVLHNTYTVCTILDIGQTAEWKYRSDLHYLRSDTVMLMEPGEVHANTHVTAPANFRVALIDPAIVERAAEELGLASPPHFRFAQVSGATHPELRHALKGLHRSLETASTPLEIQSRFGGCLRLLLEQCTESGAWPLSAETERPAVQRARDYIHEHVCDNITLHEIVEVSGSSSQFQLIRSFGETVGLTPHAYQIRLRTAKARALIAAGVPLAEVAAALGFVDQSHLHRHFVRVFGVTPGSYAKATAPFRRSGAEIVPSRTA